MFADGQYRLANDLIAQGLFPVGGSNNDWWVPSGTVAFPVNPADHFYIPDRYLDPFGNQTVIKFYSDYHLVIEETEDAVGNIVSVENFDFRMLAPTLVRDPNDNLSEVCFDTLGLVVGAAVRGKGNEADDMDDFAIDLTQNEINDFFADPKGNGAGLLQHASGRFIYDFHRYKNSDGTLPVAVASVTRETHHQDSLISGISLKLQYSFEYSDGLGRVAMKKIQAEQGDAWKMNLATGQKELVENANPRWVGDGRTVVNNKGKPVKQYEPYFSVTHEYEDAKELVEIGVTPILFYDPVGRLIKTELPNRTFSKVEFDAWYQKNYDVNDTVMDSDWFTQRIGGAKGTNEQEAAQKATIHYDTPGTVHLDSFGRSFYTIDHNKFIDKDNITREEFYHTIIELDIEGNQRRVIDARNVQRIIDNQPFVAVMEYKYDMLSAKVYEKSMDAGERWMFNNVTGKTVYAWDSRNHRFHSEYDSLQRPTKQWLTEDVLQNTPDKLIGITLYGENRPNDKPLNLRGKPFQSFDQSGRVETPEYDFKGNAKSSNKKLAIEYKLVVDWNIVDPTVSLESETFTSSSAFDALNRPVEMTMPDNSIVMPGYNEAGLLETLQAFLSRTNETVDFVKNIDYDAKGKRERILYGNNTSTSYQYEPDTFRLKRLLTTRNSGADILQDLNYTYDPTGNITSIIDNAQQTIFFNNAMVEPHGRYEYDATYRLIKATGREHAGQNAACSQFDNDKTQFNGNRLTLPGDMNAMQSYEQFYEYDSVGNMMNVIHNAGNGMFQHRWTRAFECNTSNNQLIQTTVGNEITNYQYDAHGNMLNLQNGSFNLSWNYADQLKEVNLGGGGIAYCVYDGSGQRIRKVIENGSPVKERFYFGGYEVYREIQGNTLKVERETLHIMDNKSRIALVETRTKGNDQGLQELIRYKYSNHLGTAYLELDGSDSSEIISYEEYYPYGSTAYQATRDQTETSKRYRYTGKERDEESGLYYHGARYYAPWLSRWSAADPQGVVDGMNLYEYTRDNPIVLGDPSGTQSIDRVRQAAQEYAGLERSYKENRQALEAAEQAWAAEAKRLQETPPLDASGKPQQRGGYPLWWAAEDQAKNHRAALESLNKQWEDVQAKYHAFAFPQGSVRSGSGLDTGPTQEQRFVQFNAAANAIKATVATALVTAAYGVYTEIKNRSTGPMTPDQLATMYKIVAIGSGLEGMAIGVASGVAAFKATKISPVGGVVNVGGTGERAGVSNLNPITPGTGGKPRAIPNWIKRPGEEIGQIFEKGSVRQLISSRLTFGTVNWDQLANGAHKVMAPGGKVQMNVWVRGVEDPNVMVRAFQNAGFKNVRLVGEGAGTVLLATR